MEQRPAPRVTIEGGPGEQPAAAVRDELTAGRRDEQRPRVPRKLLLAVALLGGVVWLAQARPAAPPEPPAAERPPAVEGVEGPGFVLHASDVRFETGRALLSVEVTRRTSDPLSVVGVSTIPGLSVRLVGADGQDVALPLDVEQAAVASLPAQDGPTSDRPAQDGPVQDGETQLLLAEFTLASCSSLPPFGQPYRGGTLVELQTAGPEGPGSTFVGGRYPLVPRLRQDC